MRLISLLLISFLALAVFFISSCNDDENPSSTVTLEFENVFDENPFLLNTDFTIESGEVIQPTKLLYYVTNVEFSNADGSESYIVPDSYFLINAAQEPSRYIEIPNVPNGEYTKVTFLLGVDSTRNVSGAQEGALDPVNDMFWSWNMGYIFMKLEGITQDTTQFQYHIGGFRTGANNLKTIGLQTPSGLPLLVNNNNMNVHIKVNFSEFFKNPNRINVGQMPSVLMPNANSFKIAENYANMFMIHHIESSMD